MPEAADAARRAVTEFAAAGIPLMAAEAQLRVAQLTLLAGDSPRRLAAASRGGGRVPAAGPGGVAGPQPSW